MKLLISIVVEVRSSFVIDNSLIRYQYYFRVSLKKVLDFCACSRNVLCLQLSLWHQGCSRAQAAIEPTALFLIMTE